MKKHKNFEAFSLVFALSRESSVMYQFKIVKNDDSSYRMELDGINLIVEGFYIRNEKHWIKNPDKAIAFFNVHGHLYGISNGTGKYYTAEDFYDIMCKQYAFFA